jgi:histidyl-tRNA synthetase
MELVGRSLSGQLKHANRRGARFAAIVSRHRVVLRDMQDGGQDELPIEAVTHELLQRLRALA